MEGCRTEAQLAQGQACEYHRKAGCVVNKGQRMRFCQQCQRFQLLADFDGTKRRASLCAATAPLWNIVAPERRLAMWCCCIFACTRDGHRARTVNKFRTHEERARLHHRTGIYVLLQVLQGGAPATQCAAAQEDSAAASATRCWSTCRCCAGTAAPAARCGSGGRGTRCWGGALALRAAQTAPDDSAEASACAAGVGHVGCWYGAQCCMARGCKPGNAAGISAERSAGGQHTIAAATNAAAAAAAAGAAARLQRAGRARQPRAPRNCGSRRLGARVRQGRRRQWHTLTCCSRPPHGPLVYALPGGLCEHCLAA